MNHNLRMKFDRAYRNRYLNQQATLAKGLEEPQMRVINKQQVLIHTLNKGIIGRINKTRAGCNSCGKKVA